MEDDTWKQLSSIDKISHKFWKARIEGYEELKKQIPILETNQLEQYCEYIKKAPLETNAATLDKALEFVLLFLQHEPNFSSKIVTECVGSIAIKVMNTRPKTKQLGYDICLQFVENEVGNNVIDELLKVVTNKNPKIVNGCTEILLLALKEFGGKIIDIKPIVKVVPKLLTHSDKNVRNQAKSIAIECYYYMKDSIKIMLSDIQPVQLKELEEEFKKIGNNPPPNPPRKIRSKQNTTSPPHIENNNQTENEENAPCEIDPYDFLDPVDIIPQIPDDFYTKINETSWQTRKEALESIIKLMQTPKISPGNFNNLITSLKKVVSTDVNINVCLLAINSICGLAKGLNSNFVVYSGIIVPCLLDRFKEKKPTIISAIRDAIDASSRHWPLDAVTGTVVPYYDHKIPSVREESLKYFGRYLMFIKASMLTKSLIKNICTDLIRKMDDGVAPVREATAGALAVLMKLVGEKTLNIFIGNLDDIKKNKIKSHYNKLTNNDETKVSNENTTPVVSQKKINSKLDQGTNEQKTLTKNKPTNTVIVNAPQPKKQTKENPYEHDGDEPNEPDIEEDVAIEKCMGTLLNDELLTDLSSSIWKQRLSCIETINNKVMADPKLYDPCVVFKILSKKPGWRDGNLHVFKAKFSVMSKFTSIRPFSLRATHNLVPVAAEKLGDAKMKETARLLLIDLAEAVSLNYVSIRLIAYLKSTKSIKVQCEILIWISDMLTDFGLKIDINAHINALKYALELINPEVKKCAMSLAVKLYKYMGPSLKTLLNDIKPSQLQQLHNEFEKIEPGTNPKPCRGLVQEEKQEIVSSNEKNQSISNIDINSINAGNVVPHNLLSRLDDKDWKTRAQSLETLYDIFKSGEPINNTDILPIIMSVNKCLSDTNKNVVIPALNACSVLIPSIGKNVFEFKNIILRGILGCFMGDEPNLHTAIFSALDSWDQVVPMDMTLNDDCLVVPELLSVENHNLHLGILSWLTKYFKSNDSQIPAQYACHLIQPLLKCLFQHKTETHTISQEFVSILVKICGASKFMEFVNQLDSTMKNSIIPIIDKLIENEKSLESNMLHIETKNLNTKQKPTKAETSNTYEMHHHEIDMGDSYGNIESLSKPRHNPPRINLVAGSKKKRELDDFQNKIQKWNFGSLKPHYISHLYELMAPFFSSEIMLQLFSTDFKQHISVIQVLAEICLSQFDDEKKAFFECFDLILKWCVIKFFENNPSVHMKALELIEISLQEFQKCDLYLTDYEISSFINYLIIKFGDHKENVRKLSHRVFLSLTPLYDSSKLITFLIFGLHHKLVRVKADTLSEMTALLENDDIEKFGSCLNNIALEVSKLVVDRDVTLRKNAIQFFSQLYLCIGPDIYEYISGYSKSVKDILSEKFKNIHSQYMSLKQHQLLLKEDTEVIKEPFLITEMNTNVNEVEMTSEYREELISVEQHKISEVVLSLTEEGLMEDGKSLVEPIPQKYYIDTASFLQSSKDIKPLNMPSLIPIDESLLKNQYNLPKKSSNIDNIHHFYIDDSYVSNFLEIESIINFIKNNGSLPVNNSLVTLMDIFKDINHDIVIVDIENLENHIRDYHIRNLLLWIDAFGVFNRISELIIESCSSSVQHEIAHNYIETCLYQINIAFYSSKFTDIFTTQLQSNLFTNLMYLLVVDGCYNQPFKFDTVAGLMGNVVAHVLNIAKMDQSLFVICDLIRQNSTQIKYVEFLLRFYWKCSQIITSHVVFHHNNDINAFFDTFYQIHSILHQSTNNDSNQYKLLENCFKSVLKVLDIKSVLNLPIVFDNQHLENMIKTTISTLQKQPHSTTNISSKKEDYITNIKNNISQIVNYKHSIEKLTHYYVNKLYQKSHIGDDNHTTDGILDYIVDIIKWKASLTNMTLNSPNQHIKDAKILKDEYISNTSQELPDQNLSDTPNQPTRKYISQLLDNTGSGLNLSNVQFGSPRPLTYQNIQPTQKTTSPNLASLKARLEKIKANNV